MAARTNLVDDFKEAMFEVWLRDGKTTWPIDLNSISHLFIGEFDAALIDDLQALRQQGLGDEEIGRLFVIPQRIIRLIMPFVQGMGSLGLSRDQRTEHVRYLLSLAAQIKHADPSNRDGQNLVLSPRESNVVCDDSRLSPADAKQSRTVHMLCGVLWAFAETLFFKTHGLVREFHGPYLRHGNDRRYLVRDFVCLKPLEIWPECNGLQYSNARVVTAYERLDMSVDIYNHVAIPEGENFFRNLHSFYVECDGKLLNPSEIEQLNRELSEVMGLVHKRVSAMSMQTRAEKYAEIFWYSKKNLSDRLGRSWSPPDSVREKIQSGEPKSRSRQMSEKDLRVLLRLSF